MTPATGMSSNDREGRTDDPLSVEVQRAGNALLNLATASDPLLAARIARLVQVVASEATRTQRFARALTRALDDSVRAQDGPTERDVTRRSNRRAPGALDPFAIYSEGGETSLRQRLAALDLEQLRDIVAEHGMDHDRLAMKWKDSERVLTRIVERVIARVAKGSAFRAKRREDSTGEK